MSMKPIVHTVAAAVFCVLSSAALAGEITVSAASSLTNAFKEIAQSYEAQHAGTKIRLNFGASGALLQQMEKGAPVDVFASADQDTMDQAAQKGLIATQTRRDFVRNSLVLVVPNDSRLSVRTLNDLTQNSVAKVAVGNPASVPVGRYSRLALQSVNIWPAITAKAIYTQNVRQSLDYVARGEVDAGFVYATDAAIMRDKVKVAFNVSLAKPILYPIAVTNGSRATGEAQSFINYVMSPNGQAILGRYGFLKSQNATQKAQPKSPAKSPRMTREQRRHAA